MGGRLGVKNLTFGYNRERPVFKDICLDLAPGQVFCLLGPNGTGKSTFLKCLAGLMPPLSGNIFIDHEDLAGLGARQIAMTLGFVPQSLTAAFPISVADIVVMGRAPQISALSSPSAGDKTAAQAAMERIGISHLAHRPCTCLSGGEWQLVLMARALTQSPRVLLLDEPCSHLDLGNQVRILETVAGLAGEGITILMASHFPDHAFIGADKAGILKNGEFTALGAPERVLTREALESTYGVPIRVADLGGGRKICVPILKEDHGKNYGLV